MGYRLTTQAGMADRRPSCEVPSGRYVRASLPALICRCLLIKEHLPIRHSNAQLPESPSSLLPRSDVLSSVPCPLCHYGGPARELPSVSTHAESKSTPTDSEQKERWEPGGQCLVTVHQYLRESGQGDPDYTPRSYTCVRMSTLSWCGREQR